MEPLPTWLEDMIAAAGITAYAFDVDREVTTPSIPAKTVMSTPPEAPLH